MNVAEETLGFRRASLSLALSLLMSAFALPIPPAAFSSYLHRPTERSPTVQESEVRGQKSETANPPLFPASIDALQHLRDRLVFITPALPCLLVKLTKIVAVAHPYPHFICRTNRHLNKPLEFSNRVALLGKAFGQIHTDGFARPPHLIGQRIFARSPASAD